jgi:hypothetical protein
MSKVDENILTQAHKKSFRNRKEIETGKKAGCFYCLKIFPIADITEWVDDGQTPLCPYCGIDSVLSDKSGYKLDEDFLRQMRVHFFEA